MKSGIAMNTKKKQQGLAMIYAIMVAFVGAAMASTMLQISHATSKDAATKRQKLRAQYLAEGAIESVKGSIKTALATWETVPTGSTPPLAAGTAGSTPPITVDGVPVNYLVTQTGASWQVQQPNGIQTIITEYHIAATATVDGYSYTSNRLINSEATPIFQFAVFYTNDLEIQPGANMTLKGRVHSNGNIHLGSGATLSVDTNYLRCAGQIFRQRKDDPSLSEGTVRIRQWVADPFNVAQPTSWVDMKSKSQMNAIGVSTVSGYDNNFTTMATDSNGKTWLPWGPGSLAEWDMPTGYTPPAGQTYDRTNTVLTGDHGITNAVTPQIESIKMFEELEGGTGGDFVWNTGSSTFTQVAAGTGTHKKGYYHKTAGVRIIRLPNGSFEVKDPNNANINISSGSYSGMVATSTIYDARQANGGAGNTSIVRIDMAKFKTWTQNWNASHPSQQFNGLLYTARYGTTGLNADNYGVGTGTNASGIYLYNGSELASKLTVVSEDPVYIKGDYNTTNKKGASVIGDSVNLLSNGWAGTKTNSNGLPVATATTYNVAMISGNENSAVGDYNGGLENLPRFHENWSGINCNIYGSFVNTWLSDFGTGNWVYGGNRYTAPNRNWYYDTMFNTVANLPPYTPMAVSAVDVVSW